MAKPVISTEVTHLLASTIILLVALAVIFTFAFAAPDTPVSSCINITAPDIYVLSGNVVGTALTLNSASEFGGGTTRACIKIASDDVILDCAGFTISTTDFGAGLKFGVFVNDSANSNVTIKNCKFSSYTSDIVLHKVKDVLAMNNTMNKMEVISSSNSDIIVMNNTMTNIKIQSSSDITVKENKFIAAGGEGLSSNTVDNLDFIFNNLTGKYAKAVAVQAVTNSNFSFNNITGYEDDGFNIFTTTNSFFTNNYITPDPDFLNDGFDLFNTGAVTRISNNIFKNNTLIGNVNGFKLRGGSDRNSFSFNTVIGPGGGGNIFGFLANGDPSDGNTFEYNIVNGYKDGFRIAGSDDNTFRSNNVSNNSRTGIRLGGDGSNNKLFTNRIFDNPGAGFFSSGNLTSLKSDHFYNNSPDLDILGTNEILNMTNVIFDNPLGNFMNYTNFSLNDNVASRFSIDHAVSPNAPPINRTSVANKFLDITPTSGTIVIDEAIWHWLDPVDITGTLKESKFEIWKWNGTWTDLDATKDLNANTLTITNHNPSSVYAIFNDSTPGISECQEISTSGTHELDNNLEGAPIATGDSDVAKACLHVTADDVILDCAGFTITNNGTAGTTSGIFVKFTKDKVTVKNCEVSEYSHGIGSKGFNGFYEDNTAYNNSVNGFFLESSRNNTFINNIAYENVGDNFFFVAGINNTLINNTANSSDDGNGFNFKTFTKNTTLINNTANDNINGNGFFFFQFSTGNTLMNNTAMTNGFSGFHFSSSGDNNLTKNLAKANGASGGSGGFFFSSSPGNSLTDNTATGDQKDGFSFFRSGDNILTNMNGSGNSVNGMLLDDSDDNIIDPSFFCDNTKSGIRFQGSDNNTINDSVACNNDEHGFFLGTGDFNQFFNNTAYDNTQGFRIASARNNNFTNNTAYSNIDGYHVRDSRNIFHNNSAYNNTEAGFHTISSANDNNFTKNISIQQHIWFPKSWKQK